MNISTTNQLRVNPNFIPSSFVRKTKEFFGIIESAFRALQSLFVTIPLNQKKINLLLKGLDFWPTAEKAGNCYQTVMALKNGSCLSGSHLQTYAKQTASRNVDFFSPFCIRNSLDLKAPLPPLPSLEKDLLAIPIVVKGTLRDHVMMAMVDKKNQSIEFYDPKGLSVQDRASDRLTNYPEHSLPELMQEICDSYGKEGWTITENTIRHQGDGYNCGVYVSNFLKRRSEGESFANIVQNGLSFQQASDSTRQEMIEGILNSYLYS